MALSQKCLNSSNKKIHSLLDRRRMKVEKNAPIRLKYIHSRILDHIKMRHFMENYEVDKFLNQLKKFISNVDEVEAFRKKVKYMLLTIKDSIVEFEEAISSGEVTFPSAKISENLVNEKTSQSSSGVSTFGEVSSFSSLVLTNNHFQTLQNNDSRKDAVQKEPIKKSENIISVPSNCHPENVRTNRITHHLQSGTSSKKSIENRTTELSNGEIWAPNDSQNESINDANITISSIELTNDNFQTLVGNSGSTNLNDIPRKRSTKCHEISQIRGVQKTIELKGLQKLTNVNTEKRISSNISTGQEHTTTENKFATSSITKYQIENYDYIENLKRLSLKTTEIQEIDQSLRSSQFIEENREKNIEVEKIAESIKNCPKQQSSNLFPDDDVEITIRSSDTSEIYDLGELNFNKAVDNVNVNHNCLKTIKSNEIEDENKTIQKYEKQPTIAPIQLGQNLNTSEQTDYNRDQMQKHINNPITGNEYFSPQSFSQIIQTQDMCTSRSNYYYSNNNNRALKRRCLDISSNLEMVNGIIVSETVKTSCNSLERYPIVSIQGSQRPADIRIQCDRDISDLDEELEQAKEECSRTLNDLNNIFNETKKELNESKNTSIGGYGNAKLKFPPGYEHHYKHLDGLIYDFKTTIGIPHNIYQAEDHELFFEEAINNWKELQQIVHKIKEHERRYKEKNNLDNN